MLIYKGYKKGRLTVLDVMPTMIKGKQHRMCKCLCGRTALVPTANFERNKPTCTECKTQSNYPLAYKSYDSMLQRCLNPNSPDYANYGGRGITVCDRWKEDFYYFLEDMGNRLDINLTLNRIDNTLGYCKENCNWANKTVQALNKRKLNRTFVKGAWQVYLTFEGVSTYMGRYATSEEADDAIETFTRLAILTN